MDSSGTSCGPIFCSQPIRSLEFGVYFVSGLSVNTSTNLLCGRIIETVVYRVLGSTPFSLITGPWIEHWGPGFGLPCRWASKYSWACRLGGVGVHWSVGIMGLGFHVGLPLETTQLQAMYHLVPSMGCIRAPWI